MKLIILMVLMFAIAVASKLRDPQETPEPAA
jgi:hypothetical protein